MNIETTFEWQGRNIQITYTPHYFTDMDHVEIRSGDGLPLPITSTGYRSEFRPASTPAMGMEEVIKLVTGWLKEMAQSKKWLEYDLKSRQLSLF